MERNDVSLTSVQCVQCGTGVRLLKVPPKVYCSSRCRYRAEGLVLPFGDEECFAKGRNKKPIKKKK